MEITNLIPALELSLFARELVNPAEDRPVNQFQLSNWLAPQFVEDIEYALTLGSTRSFTTAIPFRTWSTEAPIISRRGISRKSGEIPPMSAKAPITELDKIRGRSATRAGIVGQDIESAILSHANDLVRGALARVEIATADALVTGQTVLEENGLQLTVDWQRDAARSDTVANAWSNASTGTPISDLTTAVETMIDGESLGFTDMIIVMNRSTWKDLKATDQVRNSFNSVRVLDFLTDVDVRTMLSSFDIPEVFIYDAQVANLDATTRKVIPDDKVLILPRTAQIGATLWGAPAIVDEPGIEFEVQQRPGPVVYTGREIDPVMNWTILDAVVLPTLAYPDATFALTTTP